MKKEIDIYHLKKRIASSFGTKIKIYGKYASIQRKLCDIILSYIINNKIGKENSLWVDLGCGDGYLLKKLKENGLKKITGIDLSYEALSYCKESNKNNSLICGEIEHMPIKNLSLDGIITTSVLQWIFKPEETIHNLLKTLKNCGIYIFSIFIEGAFEELFKVKKIYNSLHEDSTNNTSITLFKKEEFKKILEKNQMLEVYLEEFAETVYFTDGYSFLKHFSDIGATGHSSNILTRKRLKEFCDIIERELKTSKGVPLTYKSLIGIFKKGWG